MTKRHTINVGFKREERQYCRDTDNDIDAYSDRQGERKRAR